MSTPLHCPTCGASFEDEDYCPIHGARLVPAVAEPAPAPAPAAEAGDDGEPTEPEAERIPAELSSLDGAAAASGERIAPDAEPSAPANSAGDKRLADFMRRMGLRRAGGRETSADEHPDSVIQSGNSPSPLPPELSERGWRITGTVEAHPGFDRWTVEQANDGDTPTLGAYHRFRTDALTADALYRRLEGQAVARLPLVHGHGTVDLAGARADYELVSAPLPGAGLDRWLADSTPTEQRALHLLPLLANLLMALDAAGLCALCLDPSLLQIDGNGDLCLTSAARLAAPAQVGTYRPELERSALLPNTWTAPEITQQGLYSANAMVFSGGQVLAQALWDQPCAAADLQRGAVPFRSISDARLAWVLMGCLWPKPAERWTTEQLRLAAVAASDAELPAAPPWESLAPGAASTAFSFAGASYWRLESLLDAAVEPTRWSEAIARLELILDWAEDTARVGQVTLLREAMAAGRSHDWALVALARTVRPEAPLTWRALDLSDAQGTQSLANLAQDALAGDQDRLATLRDLFRADLRGAWTPIASAN